MDEREADRIRLIRDYTLMAPGEVWDFSFSSTVRLMDVKVWLTEAGLHRGDFYVEKGKAFDGSTLFVVGRISDKVPEEGGYAGTHRREERFWIALEQSIIDTLRGNHAFLKVPKAFMPRRDDMANIAVAALPLVLNKISAKKKTGITA